MGMVIISKEVKDGDLKSMYLSRDNHTSKSSHFMSFMFDFSIRDPKLVQFLLNLRRPLNEPAGSANSQSSWYASSVIAPEVIKKVYNFEMNNVKLGINSDIGLIPVTK